MQILDLVHNDDLHNVIDKCNLNFKELAFAMRQAIKKQGRQSDESASREINEAVNQLVVTTIPNEVASQIASSDIPGLVNREVSNQILAADIPTLVSNEVEDKMPMAFPPIGSYIMMDSSPESSYDGTTWMQVDTIITETSVTIPLWKRTA